jgi:hypothetical protein
MKTIPMVDGSMTAVGGFQNQGAGFVDVHGTPLKRIPVGDHFHRAPQRHAAALVFGQ